MNNFEPNKGAGILNYKYGERRAAQSIRRCFNEFYHVEPPFADWELELHPVSRDFYQK